MLVKALGFKAAPKYLVNFIVKAYSRYGNSFLHKKTLFIPDQQLSTLGSLQTAQICTTMISILSIAYGNLPLTTAIIVISNVCNDLYFQGLVFIWNW